MKLRIEMNPEQRGAVSITNAETGECLDGVWRFELTATGQDPRPKLVLYLLADAHEIEIETASVRIERRHPPASHFGAPANDA